MGLMVIPMSCPHVLLFLWTGIPSRDVDDGYVSTSLVDSPSSYHGRV